MRTELLNQEKNIVRIKLEFDAEEFTTALNGVLKDIAENARIPGFRKGHIPRKVLEMRVGKQGLYDEAMDKILPKALEEVIADYDLDPIVPPDIKTDPIQEGQPVMIEVTYEVMPEVSLPELGDVEVEKLRAVVADEVYENTLRELKKSHSSSNAVDRAAGPGDVVTITSVTEGEQPQLDHVDLGAPLIRQDLKDALVGKSKGDQFPLELEVNEKLQKKEEEGEEKQGDEPEQTGKKKVRYDVTVGEVREVVWPEMNPEFYKKALSAELDSEEAFEAELKKRICDSLENENSSRAREAAINKITASAEMEVPDSILNREIANIRAADAADSKARFNLDLEEFLRNASISFPEYEQRLKDKATASVRWTLVMEALGKKFEVSLEKNELDAAIADSARAYRVEPEAMKSYYYKNTDQLNKLANNLRYNKISNLVLEKVKVKEVDGLTEASPLAAEGQA